MVMVLAWHWGMYSMLGVLQPGTAYHALLDFRCIIHWHCILGVAMLSNASNLDPTQLSTVDETAAVYS